MTLRIALLSIGVLVHANSLGGVFVFDDRLSIVDNPNLRALWPLGRALWAPEENPLSGRPIPALSFALNYAAGGLSAVGYKALNLALHLSCAIALFELLRRTLRRVRDAAPSSDRVAFAAALIWCVHPLTSECIDYTTQRTESWMALFLLLTLLCTVRALDAAGRARTRWRALAVASCAAGMASKEVMVVAPLLVVLFELSYSGETPTALLRTRRTFYGGLLLCWGLLAALMAASLRTQTVGTSDEVGALTYLWNQCWVLARYLQLAVWPTPLSIDWGIPRPLVLADVIPHALCLIALLAGSVALWWRRPALGFPLLVFFVVLAPTSSVVPILTEVAAERRMYVPLMALVVLGVVGALAAGAWISKRWRWGSESSGLEPSGSDSSGSERDSESTVGLASRAGLAGRWLGPVLLGAVVIALASASVRRHAEYRSKEGLWRGAVAAFPDNPRAHASLGQAVQEYGDLGAAIGHYRDSIALDPGYAEGHNELGIALAESGAHRDALEHFDRAIAADPRYARPHYNKALALLMIRDRSGAVVELEEALRLSPAYPTALTQLAWLLATDPDPARRRPERALALAERGLQLGGPRRTALDALAAAAAATGDFERAVKVATRAVRAARRGGAPNTERVRAIEARLDLYRRGQPYLDPVSPGSSSPAPPLSREPES